MIAELRPKVSRFPGVKVFLVAPPSLRIGGHQTKSAYDFTLQGPDTVELYAQAQKLQREIAKLPGLVDVTTDLQVKNPQVNLDIDRDRAAALGLDANQIESALYSAFGPRWSSTIYAPTNQYKVLLGGFAQISGVLRLSVQAFLQDVRADNWCRSSNFASLKEGASAQSINHSGQFPSVTVSFNAKPGVALGDAVNMVQETARRVLPANMNANFEGTAQAFQSSLKNLTLLLIIAILVVYIVLGVLYESYIHPLTILSGLPSAGVGALLTLMIFHVDLNIYSFVGLMMLIGIVKKNAIMQIDFALEAERKEGKTPLEAIYEGCLIRFRPIMMTTMAALLGALPVALGYGAGGESRRPLGLAVVGGLLFSQLITLYLTPVVYTYMASVLEWGRRRKRRRRRLPAAASIAPQAQFDAVRRRLANQMNFSETFIRRPIATSLMMAAIALFGLVAYRSLPVSDLPNVDFPTLLVTASLPGASPDTMASAVATPLENQFSNISGLDSMTSTNSLGSTQVTLEFVLNKSLDGAAVDVQSAITQAARLLPQGMPTPPTFTKVNPADQPILYLAITSQTLPLWTLDEYAETRIAQRISMVSGVAQVQVLGAQKYAVHAQVDPHLLASRQIGINEVQTALSGWNVNLPTGSIIGPQRAFTLQATGQLMSAAQYRPLIVAYRNGSPVRLEELGNVIDSVEDDKTASWFYTKQGTQRAIILGVQRQPGTNTIAVTDAVKNLLPTFRSEIPASVKMDILYDRSDTIRESYKDVQFTMLLTLGLVVMVIFLFLRNVSATVIPAWRCPSPSSAPSPSCTCCTTAWTTCR